MGIAVEATGVAELVTEGEAKTIPRRRGDASVDWAWTWGRRDEGV